MRRLSSFVLLLSMTLLAETARADEPLALTLRGEADLGIMLTDTYRDRFDLGGGGTVRVGLEVLGPLLELRVSGGGAWFPVPNQDPGTLFTLGAGARSTVVIDRASLPALGGPFFDLDLLLAITGDLVRGAIDVGVGWSFFPVDAFTVGPVVRYTLLIQDPSATVSDPASLLFFGLDLGGRFELESRAAPIVEPPPPSDDDSDGVRGDDDRCPTQAEDGDGFEDDDGCPDPDDDSDGYPDADDVCPRLAETRNGFDDEDGCPDEAPPPPGEERVVIRHGAEGVPLPHHVYFRLGSSRVSGRYTDEIHAVCELMASRPEARLRVLGHADEQGNAAANQRLGAERAGAVAEQLILCGVEPARIESTSYGDSRPACTETTEECQELRRRVEFELLEPTE